MERRRSSVILPAFAAVAVAGCSSAAGDAGKAADSGPTEPGSGVPETVGDPKADGKGFGAFGPSGAPAPAVPTTPKSIAPPPVPEVFGHSPDTLYRLDPETKAATVVGSFEGCSDVTDLAIDDQSNLFVTTFSGL